MRYIMQRLGKCHPSNCPTRIQCRIAWWVLAIIFLSVLWFCIGCEGTGLNKSATVVPDRIGVAISNHDNRDCPDSWPTGMYGITISAQWDLK